MKTYQELLGEARRGGRVAFGELAARFRSMALSVARRHLSDESLVEDAVQEAFLTAFLKLDQLRNPTAFPSWLKAIVYSACRKLRKENVPTVPLDGGAELDAASWIEGPEELCVRWQTREMVARTLESLPGAAREACWMRYVQGLSYREIADSLGLPMGTVKRRLHEARQRIIRSSLCGERATLRVGFMPITDHLLAMVSHQRRDSAACDIQLRKFLSWDSLARALGNGHLDAAFVMLPLALHLRGRGVPLRYVLNAHLGGSSMTVRKTIPGEACAGIARMGLPHSVSTHEILFRNLLAEGRLEDGARWQGFLASYASPPYADRLLRERALDAFFCSEPWGAKAVAEGWGRQLFRSSSSCPDHVCCGLAVREDLASRHPGLLECYTALLRDAGRHVERDPRAGARIQSLYTGVDASLAEHVLLEDGIRFGDLKPDRETVARVMDQGLRLSCLSVACDLDAFLHPSFH
ncbi:sigma-70 family RNA polymerase sigma factor [Desulfocurvus sp. DL9XJH121]